MKNVLFLTRLFSPHIGGVEKHVLEISTALIQSGYKVTVITEQLEPNQKVEETLHQIKVLRIPFGIGTNKIKLWKWMWQHRKIFQEADVVHVHDVFWWIAPLLPLIRKKYFITFHGWEGIFPVKNSARAQRQLAAKSAQGVVQVGEYIEKWYGTKPSMITYGGINPNQFKQKRSAIEVLKKVFKAAKDGTAVSGEGAKYAGVFIGRLSADNDIQKVIKFFQLWKKTNPSEKFVFVGDGEYRTMCEELGEVTGFVTDPEKYLLNTKVVCASSYLGILESQFLKKMVVSFYSNPLKKDYLVGYPQSKNMIVEEQAEVAWKKIKELYADKRLWQARIEQAQIWVEKQTWQKLSTEYEQLWNLNA